jgi:very-short-patch-repair endonuclease
MADTKGRAYYRCNYCGIRKSDIAIIKDHVTECKSKIDKSKEGIEYVVCSICNFHAKSLGSHVSTIHGIDKDEYKKDHQIICQKSSDTYKAQNGINGDWIERAKESGEDLAEYCQRMGNAVKDSILANPEERKRRAGVMADVNRSGVMRKKASDTAKKTSARRDIQLQRVAKIHAWQKANPEVFYDKCISKALCTWHSEPEKLLFEILSQKTDYNFRLNQTVKSDTFPNKSKRRQVDMGDRERRVYVEYDGQLHFRETKLKQLENVRVKDTALDEHIEKHGWVLIRVGYDQFSYRKSDYGFKPECLAKIDEILNDPKPGVHRIGSVYG